MVILAKIRRNVWHQIHAVEMAFANASLILSEMKKIFVFRKQLPLVSHESRLTFSNKQNLMALFRQPE